MKSARRTLVAGALALAALVPVAAQAQDLHPSRRPSPLGVARISLDDAYVKVVYSRPYKRDRDNIFGSAESKALVPFGERWRTGANEATEITTTRDLVIAGQKLPAGTYSLFTTPGAESWKVHFNSTLGLSGTGYFYPETGKFEAVDLPPTDVVTVEVPVKALEEKDEVDQFTISFAPTEGGAEMVLTWIRTEVRVPFTVAK
ncbi:MAG: hypothetical protein AMXMBFR36_03270 [Acidobacteriota bacterium]